jgi:hypothetical protein
MAAVRAIGLRCRLRKGLIGQLATLELRARPRPWRRRAHVETCCSDSTGIPTLCFSTSGKSWGNAGPAHQQIGTLAWAALQGEDRHEDHNNRPRDCSRRRGRAVPFAGAGARGLGANAACRRHEHNRPRNYHFPGADKKRVAQADQAANLPLGLDQFGMNSTVSATLVTLQSTEPSMR